MARELHDVLAHNISMINVQAGVALHLIDQNPEQARTALAAIKDASKEALTEMRGVIGALRAQGETAPRAPPPGSTGWTSCSTGRAPPGSRSRPRSPGSGGRCTRAPTSPRSGSSRSR